MMTTRLKLAATLLLVVGALSTAAGLGLTGDQAAAQPSASEPAAPRPPARLDLHGDPLPAGALVRLGTVRMQHDGEVTAGFFAADGKSLTTAGVDRAVRQWDLATGKEQRHFMLQLTEEERHRHSRHLPSPDGKTLATIHTNSPTGESSVYLWDLATGKPRVLDGRPKAPRYFTKLAFSADGAILAAVSSDSDVRTWDVASSALVRQVTTPGSVAALAFPASGALLAVDTAKEFIILEAATSNEVRRFQRVRSGSNVAFSADGKKLAVAETPVRVWDLGTGKTLLEINLDERVDLGTGSAKIRTPRDVAFSPDGKLLAVDLQGTVAVVDTATGNKLHTVLGDRRFSNKPSFFSPDGRYLAVPGQMTYYLYETATGKPLHHDGGHQGAVNSVAFAPNGKMLATADLSTVRLWDATSGKELRHWPNYLVRDASKLAFAPDGKSLAHAGGVAVKLWDPATGAELPKFKSLHADTVAFSPDGALLGTLSASGLALWDSATGGNVRRFDKENGHRPDVLAYSPDGKTLAGVGNALYLWDVASGKRRHKIEPPTAGERSTFIAYTAAAFSPDGAYVAAFGGRNLGSDDTRSLNLFDVGTGKQVGRFQTTACQKCHTVLAFSPDGKTLALGDTSRDVTLWEVITGKQRAKLTGHRRFMQSLAFAPDGQRLASASADGTALVWDLRAGAKVNSAAPDVLWQLLASEDATAAYVAIQALVHMPEQALPLFRQRLKPVATVETRRLAALVADLDSNSFKTRQMATAELEQLGDLAEAALRKAIAAQPSLEVRQRLDDLLGLLATIQVSSPELLQALRGVEALEQVGTADARELLRVLGAGAQGARQTREAKAALDRLARRDGS